MESKRSKFNSPSSFSWKEPGTEGNYNAGGVLFYDDEGFWVVEEKQKDVTVCNDIGGRYHPDDGNIWATIRREVWEETYGTCDFTMKMVTMLSKTVKKAYLHSPQGVKIYVCLCIDKQLQDLYGITLNPDTFNESRKRFLEENPNYTEFYKTLSLKKIRYEDVHLNKLSYRLNILLKEFLLH
jgi:hypothetical protein